MRFVNVLFGMFWCLTGYPAIAVELLGVQDLPTLYKGDNRPLNAMIWYPANPGGVAESIGENQVFEGVPGYRNAPPREGRRALVVLSHGYGGNWRNQSWLASALVRRGYIVVSLDHPGTTTMDMNTQTAAHLWQRPEDIRRLLDHLENIPAWSNRIHWDRIAVIGHSLGGWTAMALAGGRLDTNLLDADCPRHPELAACRIHREIHLGGTEEAKALLNGNMSDPRVKAVVSMDLGLARGFSSASLAAISIPVLVVAAGSPNPELPADLESRHLAAQLNPGLVTYLEVQDATHFSFVTSCKPGAASFLKRVAPGEEIICQDSGQRPRPVLHEHLTRAISDFLQRTLGRL